MVATANPKAETNFPMAALVSPTVTPKSLGAKNRPIIVEVIANGHGWWFFLANFCSPILSVWFAATQMLPFYISSVLQFGITGGLCRVVSLACIYGRHQRVRVMGRNAMCADFLVSVSAAKLVPIDCSFILGLILFTIWLHALVRLRYHILDISFFNLLLMTLLQLLVYLTTVNSYVCAVVFTVILGCYRSYTAPSTIVDPITSHLKKDQ